MHSTLSRIGDFPVFYILLFDTTRYDIQSIALGTTSVTSYSFIVKIFMAQFCASHEARGHFVHLEHICERKALRSGLNEHADLEKNYFTDSAKLKDIT